MGGVEKVLPGKINKFIKKNGMRKEQKTKKQGCPRFEIKNGKAVVTGRGGPELKNQKRKIVIRKLGGWGAKRFGFLKIRGDLGRQS